MLRRREAAMSGRSAAVANLAVGHLEQDLLRIRARGGCESGRMCGNVRGISRQFQVFTQQMKLNA